MARPGPISGFPEWLPEQQLVEQTFKRIVAEQFELHGFAPLETRSVEPLDWLLAKGETDKEIYVLRRLQAAAEDDNSEFGLHFDLTIPFARYTLQNRGRLVFPYRRYQIQKAWRGERPQEGRYREFYQADADVIAEGELPEHFETEMVALVLDVTAALPIPPVRVHVSHRKVLEGFYRGLGVEDPVPVLRTVDKLDKLGVAQTKQQLQGVVGLGEAAADKCLELATINATDASFVARVRALGIEHAILDEGLDALQRMMDTLAPRAPGRIVADLRIARGLDYYTGMVCEGFLDGATGFGAVCSGGRYDDLASGGSVKLPGVGVSIGISRLLGYLLGRDMVAPTRSVPTCVLVAVPSEDKRAACEAVARTLRGRGIATEVFHSAAKYGKQIRYAERKGIPYVWFPEAEGSKQHEVRDIRQGEQSQAEPQSWTPVAEDLRAGVEARSPNKA